MDSSNGLLAVSPRAGGFAAKAWKFAIAAIVAAGLASTLPATTAHAGGKFLAGAIIGGLVAGAVIHHARRNNYGQHQRLRVARYHRPYHHHRRSHGHHPVLILPFPVLIIGNGW